MIVVVVVVVVADDEVDVCVEGVDALCVGEESYATAASLDVLKLRKLVAGNRYEDGIKLLERVVKMLTDMV